MVEREHREGAYLGMGYNPLTGEFRNTAIKVDSRKLINNQDLEREVQQKVYFSYEHITDEEMLANSLEVSGSGFNKTKAGFDLNDFGLPVRGNANASFSAKGNFSNRRSWKNSHTYILVKCVVENEKYRIRNPALTQEARKILEGKDGVANFREKFGDEFIVGFGTGGEYFALIKASSFDAESQTHLAADIRAEVEFYLNKFGFEAEHKVGVNVDARVDNFQRNKHMDLEVSAYRAGCEDIGHAFVMSIEQIVKEVSSLPAYVKETGGIKFTSIFSDYGTITDVKDNQLVSKELRRQKNAIADLENKKREDLNKLFNIERQLEQGNYESQMIKNERNEIAERIYEIDKYIRQYIENPRLIDEEIIRGLRIWN